MTTTTSLVHIAMMRQLICVFSTVGFFSTAIRGEKCLSASSVVYHTSKSRRADHLAVRIARSLSAGPVEVRKKKKEMAGSKT